MNTRITGIVVGAAMALAASMAFAGKPVPPPTVTTIEIQQAQGRSLLDLNGDGAFEGQGGLDVGSYSIWCDTRLDEVNDVIRVGRTALEFDVSQFLPRKEQKKILSAKLVMEVAGSRNLMQQNLDGSFAPATWTLNGYAGDGVVGVADAINLNPIVVNITAPPASFVEIDVTAFVKAALAGGSGFAGFMFQIPGDYVRNNFQDSQVFAKDDLTYGRTGPRLVIVMSGGRR